MEQEEARNLQQEISDGVHGFGVKFVYHYSRHLSELREMMDGYAEIEERFGQLCAHYTLNASSSKRSSALAVDEEPAKAAPPKTSKMDA